MGVELQPNDNAREGRPSVWIFSGRSIVYLVVGVALGIALFRLANTLHIKTRPRVIRRQLLFKSGDRYVRRVVDETERILRTNSYFYDAWIQPVRYHDGKVDLKVTTKDVWTLNPGFNYSRSGGTM